MAARMTRIQSTAAGHFAWCTCGWRSDPLILRRSAEAAADQHRAAFHHRQAQLAAAQRRHRSLTA